MSRTVNRNQTLEEFRNTYNNLASDIGSLTGLAGTISNSNTLVDAINRIVDSDGNLKLAAGSLDSDTVLNHMIADDQVDSDHIMVSSIDSDHLKDSSIFGAKFEAMTVLKIFNSTGTELRKLYAPSIFDHDSAIAFATNPWV